MNAPRPGLDPRRLPTIAAVISVGPGDRSWRELLPIFERLAPGIERRLVFGQAGADRVKQLAKLGRHHEAGRGAGGK